MRRLLSCFPAGLLLIVLSGLAGTVAHADPPAPSPAANAAPAAPQDPESALEQGLTLERSRNWAGAIEAYHTALERWPSRVDFSRRLRLCEIHFKLSRRYRTPASVTCSSPCRPSRPSSCTTRSWSASRPIMSTPCRSSPWSAMGSTTSKWPCATRFSSRRTPRPPAPEQVDWLRETLRQYRAQLNVPDRASAIRLALVSSEAARTGIGMASTPVLLEFTCGACDALDDFTSYLTPDKLEDLYAMIDGNFVGLGVELKLDKEGLRLVGVIRGGPAWEAGLKAGDQIVKIGGRSIKGLGLDEAANRLQGSEGTTLELGVKRRDGTRRRFAWSAATSTSKA